MAGEVDGIRKTGQGFFNQEGQLKSTEQLKKEEAPKAEKSDGDAAQKNFSTDVISNSLATVRKDFREDANQAISTLNQDDAVLKDAQKVVKEQIRTAKELKAAIKNGDTETADKKRAELSELQTQREEIAKRVQETNNEQLDERVQGIRLGNRTVQTVRREDIKFSSGDVKELDTKKDVNQVIKSLEADRDSISAQRKEIKETRQAVKETVDEGTAKLDKLEENSIRSFSEASQKAEDLASRIRGNSQQALAFNVNESVVKQLLS